MTCFFKKVLIKLFKVLSIFNQFTNKKETRIVLYSNIGFRDNVKSVYEYLVEHKFNRKYEIICAVNEYKTYKKVVQIENIKFVNCYIGVYYYLFSKYFFYSFGKYPIIPSKKQCVVNLWHGMPLKKIGALVDEEKDLKQNYFTHLIATSEFFADIMQRAFRCDRKEIVVTGQPRNDDLFDKDVDLKKLFNIDEQMKLVCYMPTFRTSNILKIDNSTTCNSLYNELKDNSRLKEIDEELNRLKVVLFIKPHPMENFDIAYINHLKNIVYVDEDKLENMGLNTYKFLSSIDALLTDYSSIYFDYLLLNRPIGFIVDDLTEYGEVRGFIVDNPLKIMPGKKIYNLKEFIEFFKEVSLNIDDYDRERKVVNELCNYYKDDKGSERVLSKIGIKK